jgi:hypothetical protein
MNVLRNFSYKKVKEEISKENFKLVITRMLEQSFFVSQGSYAGL